MRRLENGDTVWFKRDEDGSAIVVKASVCIIDHFMMQLQIEVCVRIRQIFIIYSKFPMR